MNLQVSLAPRQGIGLLTAIFLVFVSATWPQGSASVAQANLNYLVDNAQTIVRGNVVSATIEPHPQFPNIQTVLVTVAVAKTLKGQAGPTLTFRQYVWNVKDGKRGGGYHKSEQLLLFLNPTSLYGLTSPVGMEQGHFRIVRDSKGQTYAVNGRGNVGLFSNVLTRSAGQGVTLSAQARTILGQSGGQVPLSTLEETIQALVAARP